jgi:large subunit ribosomal protein L13
MKEHTIDATNRPLGRVASEAAVLLRGKETAEFQRNVVPEVKVIIENSSKVKIGEKKLTDKKYISYSGYPGGQKERSLQDVLEKRGYQEVFKRAVYGMLPDNRLRSKMMNNLIVKE